MKTDESPEEAQQREDETDQLSGWLADAHVPDAPAAERAHAAEDDVPPARTAAPAPATRSMMDDDAQDAELELAVAHGGPLSRLSRILGQAGARWRADRCGQ